MKVEDGLIRGSKIEHIVASMFQREGYLVRRMIPLTYGPDNKDATDIDIFGVKFTNPFQPIRIICDCKDRQKSRPYERIFWARGLADFIHADETYVSLPKASPDIINLAKEGGVRVLSQSVLQGFEKKVDESSRKGVGLADDGFFETYNGKSLNQLKSDKESSYVLFNIKRLYLVRDPYVSINICMSFFKKCQKKLLMTERDHNKDLFDLWLLITADLVVLFSLLLLYVASDTLCLSKDERSNHITQKLTYGDMSPKKAEEIFQLSKRLAMEAAQSLAQGGTSQQSLFPFDLGKIDAPEYAEDVAGIVERVIGTPSVYHHLPQIMDYLLFAQSLPMRKFDLGAYSNTYRNLEAGRALKAARNIFMFLVNHTSISPKLFWPEERDNMPTMPT